MIPVEQMDLGDGRAITIAKDQPPYAPLPALVFPDGRVLIEWSFSEEERAAITKGENLRHWIWTMGQPLQPIHLEITNERIA
jgi:hypothetical protein